MSVQQASIISRTVWIRTSVPSAFPGIPSNPVSLHGFLYWEYTGNSNKLKSHSADIQQQLSSQAPQWVCMCCPDEMDPVSHEENSAPKENCAIQRCIFILPLSKSRSSLWTARARSHAFSCPATSQLFHPSPSSHLPPPSYPGASPSPFAQIWVSCKRIKPTSTRKKIKKAVLFPLVHYASEILGSTNTGGAPENMILQTLLEAETGKH